MKTFLSAIKQVILWSYQRGSWQYDILCILILAFILLTPSEWFNPPPGDSKFEIEQPAPPPPPTEQRKIKSEKDESSPKMLPNTMSKP